LVLDAGGNLYIGDTNNFRIRKVAAATGFITTVAGNGTSGFAGDGGPATAARLANPAALMLDSSGNLYLEDNFRIRKISAITGTISTVAGNGSPSFGGDGGPAASASLGFTNGVALDPSGNFYVAGNGRIRKIVAATGIIATVVGNGTGTFNGDGGAATRAGLNQPVGVALDANRNVYIAENQRIRKVDAATGVISTVAGGANFGFAGDGGAATAASLAFVTDVTLDAAGNLYIADASNNRIRKVAAATGIITTVAGGASPGFAGDGGPATGASLNFPVGITLDASGNLYIGDQNNGRIRKVYAGTGIITTLAGNGSLAFAGDDGPATSASLNHPGGLALDASGNLYIADQDNFRVRRVAAATGIITTVAGNGNVSAGDGGPATNAGLVPRGVALDASGNLYVVDAVSRIRKVNTATGIITTVAGIGVHGFTGDGGPATSASFNDPQRIALDASGNLYIADHMNNRIRRVLFVVAHADFNGDGKSDVLWRHQGSGGSGENYVYPLNGTSILANEGYLRTVADLSWTIAATGDFDGDGKADILWRNSSTGENYIYFMNGSTIALEAYVRTVADQNWQVAGIGDFDGDGKADILWRNASTGENYIYFMHGSAIFAEGYLRTVADPSWQIVGVGDFDGDAKSDILWRNSTTGENYLYPMDGTMIKPGEGYFRTVANLAWQVKGVGDFNGDGKADIAWRNSATGENYLYLMSGTTIAGEGYIRTVADQNWRIVAVGDYDGDAKGDLLWRNAVTGQNYLYPLDGTTIKASEGYLRTVADQNWQVQR
jgi:hypothetical protein